MRRLTVYYPVILVPFAVLLIAARFHAMNDSVLAIMFVLYFFFRQLTDAWRLYSIGVINRISWKVLINPLLQANYFAELYFRGRKDGTRRKTRRRRPFQA